MKHVPLIALAVALLAHPASPFALLAPRPLRAATAAARIFTPLRMEEDAAEEPAADAAEPSADDAAPPPAPPEEEEEDDLLSSPAFLKQKVKVLEKELEELTAEAATLTAQAEETAAEFSQKRERLQTDFDNFKARHYNQTRDAQIDAKIKLVNDFLPVLDNFDRARTSISPDGATQEATNAEYQEVHARLMATLGELGMEKIEAVGTEFDYNLHMAIQQQPSDEYDEGVVCAEMQPGYTLGGKLLRAAYVMVSAGA